MEELKGKVLLVGEGNFSFSAALWRKQQSSMDGGGCRITRLWTSCQESCEELLSPCATENLAFLRQQEDVSVLLGVDATSLHLDPRLWTLSPDWVAFNFPHVGGKMRIERNRRLLRDFLQSAATVLPSRNGKVLVSLCQGQGGTPAETSRRVSGDTWGLVEVAASAGMLVESVRPFPDYFGYVPGGYRGLERRRFRTEGALVHVLRFGEGEERVEDVLRGILLEPEEASRRTAERLPAQSVVGAVMRTVLRALQESGLRVLSGLAPDGFLPNLNEAGLKDLSLASGSATTAGGLVHGAAAWEAEDGAWWRCLVTVSGRSCNWTQCVLLKLFPGQQDSFFLRPEGETSCSLDVGRLSLFLSKGSHLEDVRQLWTLGGSFVPDAALVLLPSRFPLTFEHDLSFWESPVDFFEEEKMLRRLRAALRWDLLVQVKLQDVFRHPDSERVSRCYRFTYRSFRFPLSRDGSIRLHQEVGRLLEEAFLVSVR